MINTKVFFDKKHSCYRARFWEAGVSDSKAKVPDEFWQELGIKTPTTPAPKFQQLAERWATREADRRENEEKNESVERSRKLTMREVWTLYRQENPRGVGAETIRHNAMHFAALERHTIEYRGREISIADMLPELIDEPVVVRYRNARLKAKVLNAGSGKTVELDKTVRNRTVNNETDLLQRLVRFAWKWRSQTGMASMILDEVDRLPDQDSTMIALSEGEIGELLAVAPPLKARMIIFAICSEIREENLFGLRGEWINWAEGWLHIPAEFMKKGRSKAARALSRPLPKIAMEQLGPPRLSGYIWTNPQTGVPYTRLGLDALCEAAKIRAISEHDLRTTGNTLLANVGVDHLSRKALMGHTVKTGDVTDLYTKVSRDRLEEAVKHFDTIFARILRPSMKVVSIEDHR
jgi:integrase